MGNESNLLTKKIIQKVSDNLLKKEEYNNFSEANIFFVFGSKHKTAMCDFVYGIKVKSKTQLRDNFQISKLQSDIKTNMNRHFDINVCCSDFVFEVI